MNYLNDGGNYVKLYKNRNQLLIIFLAVGFFVGILYENIVSKRYGMSIELFQTYFLKQFQQVEFMAEEYLWYVAKARVLPVILLCLLGCLKCKKVIVSAWVSWIGFLMGIVIVAAMIQLGIKGILFCLAGLLPHMVCYAMAYGVVLLHFYCYPTKKWNGAKTIFVVLMMVLGIVLETHLSPIFIKMIVGMF